MGMGGWVSEHFDGIGIYRKNSCIRKFFGSGWFGLLGACELVWFDEPPLYI